MNFQILSYFLLPPLVCFERNLRSGQFGSFLSSPLPSIKETKIILKIIESMIMSNLLIKLSPIKDGKSLQSLCLAIRAICPSVMNFICIVFELAYVIPDQCTYL